jgi:hypothetical protein
MKQLPLGAPRRSRGAPRSSAVGRLVIGLARARGLRTLNVVRRDAHLGAQILTGALPAAPVEQVYAIDQIKAALAHAQRGERGAKILVAPNGAI